MSKDYFPILLALGLGLVLTFVWLSGIRIFALATSMDEFHVCPSVCPFSSIQAAVNAAQAGDVIKVAQGNYTDVHHIESLDTSTFTPTQIVIITKSITLLGGYTTTNWNEPDPDAYPSILNAEGQGRVMVISGTISPAISGFHITGGDSKGLGGMFWGDVGGGIYVANASADISNNQIYSNTATWYGGGIYLLNSNATISQNLFSDNVSQNRGGGLYLDSSPTILHKNIIQGNTTGFKGGGISSYWSTATLTKNVFGNNTSGTFGGGLYLYGMGGTLNGNLFLGNHATYGGGMHIQYESGNVPMLINNAFVGNQATEGSGIWFGGDQYSSAGTVQALHTTLHDNNGAEGIYVGEYASLALTNTIIASHTLGITVTAGSSVTMNATLWHGNDSNQSSNVIHINDYYGDPLFATDGYHIETNSAAVDAGVNSGIKDDVDGEFRPQGLAPDIGSDELSFPSIYLPLVIR